MGTLSSSPAPVGESSAMAHSVRVAFRIVWHSARLPILGVLVILEPFVSITLSALTVLGIFFSLFFRFLIRLPHFPFWLMMGLSIGCAMTLMLYYLIVRMLSDH